MSNLLKQYDPDKYSDIAKEVKEILSDVLKKEENNYALFGITARPKSLESLERKITKNNIGTLDSIKDLAGCRVIFFYNHDVRKFNDSNIIYDHFDSVERIVHHRTSDLVDDTNKLYTAVHYVVKLKSSNRLSLKYIDEDLKCEIQIHTLINHAYSETIHNITYKKPHNLIIGKKALEEIDNNFKDLKQNYLLPAGHYLNTIVQNYQQILEANDLTKNIIPAIQNASYASELLNILDQWKKKVATYYDDREVICDYAVQIIDSAIKKWKNYEQDADAQMLLVKIIEILVYVMPLDVNSFFPKIANLYQNGIEKNILDEINEYLVYITRYSKYHNYEKQAAVLDLMSEWDDENLIKMVDFVFLLCKELLQLEGMQLDWVQDINYKEPGKSTSAVEYGIISFSNLPDKVIILRSRTIAFLIKLYSLKGITRRQKAELILVLSDAAKLPTNATYDTSLSRIVLSNLVVIVEFYTRILPQEPFLCKLIYNQVFEFRRLAGQLIQQEEVKNSAQELWDLTDIFKNELIKIKDFEIYNTLLSTSVHDYINDVKWRQPLNSFEFAKRDKDIETKMSEYIHSINSETEVAWEKIILECAINKGGSLFKNFLFCLGCNKPLFALSLLYKYETKLLDYLINIFNGLLSSEKSQQAKNLLETWIIQGKYLERVVCFSLDYCLINLLYKKAKNENNLELLECMLKSILRYYNNRQFVLPIIEIFTKAKVALNAHIIIEVINIITDQDLEKILENLLHCKELDQNYLYRIEIIASRKAEIIIPFFQKVFDSSSPIVISDSQEAWATGEHIIEPLDNLNHYASLSPKLFSFLFAVENKKAQDLLYSLINSGKKITFIIETLNCYEKRVLGPNNNIEGILNVIKQLIINNKLSDNEITKLESIITRVSNVAIGNYGYSEAVKLRQEIIGQWQNCNNVQVKNFAESVYKKLDQMVKSSRFYEEPRAIMEI